MSVPAAVVVLAAGEGKRMKSATPKMLHEVCGRSLLGHVLAAVGGLNAEHTVIVVGHGRDQVTAAVETLAPEARCAVQEQQRGTGDAVRHALAAIPGVEGTVVVVPGDAPLLTTDTLARLVLGHEQAGAAATLLTADLDNPTGYGRVVRDETGAVTGIVEQRDASPEQLAITEVGTSIYAFDAALLRDGIERLTTDNSQGEEYLTDVVGILVGDGRRVGAVSADASEASGVNDRAQLAEVGAALRARLLRDAALAGVTVVDPVTTWIDAGVVLEADAVIEPFTILRGSTRVASGAVVGPYSQLTDTEVGEGATVVASTCIGAVIGPRATVGPYTYLRPKTRLGVGAKAGGYVELKATTVGDGSKVPHLSYLGDTVVGVNVNVGAGTITCNYDGTHKHATTIGDDVFIGSDTMLVAPVTIGPGAFTAAGSVITQDVPDGALGVGRAQQRNIEGWAERRRRRTAEGSDSSAAKVDGSDEGAPQ